jgi:hypothetical protein
MQSQKILEGLNDAQRQAVETVEGPLLIVAGPGSGKTRVITHRVAYLVNECGVRPYRILAVTFTNKAANEMKARLEGLLGGSAEDLVMGTFHSFCARLLRRDGHHVGLEPNYTIYDEEDALNVVRRAMEELAIDPKRFPPGAIRENISRSCGVPMSSPGLWGAISTGWYTRCTSVTRRFWLKTMPLTSTTFCCVPCAFWTSTPRCWSGINSAFYTYWWTNFRIPI